MIFYFWVKNLPEIKWGKKRTLLSLRERNFYKSAKIQKEKK